MSLYQVQKLLFNLHNDLEFRTSYKSNPKEIMKEYDLADSEVKTLLDNDIGSLFRMGVNPWLLFQYSSYVVGVKRDAYLKQIRGE